MDKVLLKELAYQDEKLKEKIIGPNTKRFIENLSSNYDLEAIKANIEQVNNNDSIWFKLSTLNVGWGLGIIIILVLIYWYLWGLFAGLIIGFFSFIILCLLENQIDAMSGYNELSFSIINGYNDAKSKDDAINKKK